MRRKFSLLLLVLFVPGMAAAVELAPNATELTLARPSGPLAASGLLAIVPDKAAIAQVREAGSLRIADFALPGAPAVELELVSFSPLASDARIVLVEGEEESAVALPDLRFFRGQVAGVASSLAYLWVDHERIGGFVMLPGADSEDDKDGQLFVFGPRSARAEEELGREHVIVLAEGSAPAREVYCGTEFLDTVAAMPGRDPYAKAIDSTTLLKARIAVDSTFEYYNHFGNATNASNYAAALMGAVSTIYESNVLCVLELSFLRLFSTNTDPYNSGGSASTLLGQLRTEWMTNPAVSGLARTVTHLFHKEGGMGGVAYVDVLCNTSFGYGVSALDCVYTYPNAGYTWDADVTSHELGHNFGSPHTHCYVPPIDFCYAVESGCYSGPVVPTVGTIMSYCHLVASKTLVFSQRERDLIRPKIEAAACIEAAGSPGDIKDPGQLLMVAKPNLCPTTTLSNDDNSLESITGYTSTAQANWVKRFTPTCYPYRLTRADVYFYNHASIVVGRPIRLLVYRDAASSGNPNGAGTQLIYTQDVTIQALNAMNQYTLTTPVTIPSGQVYIGFYDLLPDPSDTIIISIDTSRSGDSYRKANSTTPGGFTTHTGGTFLIRAVGGSVDPTGLTLTWGNPCNNATVPNQDFAVYQGNVGAPFNGHTSLACTTSRALTYSVASTGGGNLYFLAVPQTSVNEGKYGGTTAVSPSPCKPQLIGACP